MKKMILMFLACAAGVFAVSCTPAEQQTAVQAIPSEVTLVGCIVGDAVQGKSLMAIVSECGADATTVGAELLALVEQALAGPSTTAALKTSPAFQAARGDFAAQTLAAKLEQRVWRTATLPDGGQ